ncbi:MAG: hypothetical protein ABSD67_08445 [Terracidiphilus sp.]|jgi:hypothetical protein
MNRFLQMVSLSVLLMGVFSNVALAKAHTGDCPRDSRLSVDMPILLATGTIRTPEFIVKNKPYDLDLRVQWNMPTDELKCKMGFQLSPGYPVCKDEPLIEVEWTVWDGEQTVAHGVDEGRSEAFEAGACYFARVIGEFTGKSKHKYVVEVKVKKDATPLNVTNPRLVVTVVTGNAF